MRRMLLFGLLILVPSAASGQWTALDVPERPANEASLVEAGREIYDEHCWYCHGEEGDGLGPVARYLWPRPRDFQLASFKFRTTPSGELPTDEDLFRTITLGAPGTAMPAWEEVLTVRERWQVIAYLKSFGGGIFEDEAFDPYDVALDMGRAPDVAVDSLVNAGRRVYEESDCWECHGAAGRGDGPKADQLTGDLGLPIRATDLELAWKFRGGSTPRDIFLRLGTGLDGTPMPSYAQTLTEEERWQVAYFVASLATDATADAASVVIPALRLDVTPPEDPADALWDDATPVRIPLTGQATYPPRWQIPAVTDLEIRAVHDADEVAIRVAWNDPVPDVEPDDGRRASPEGWTAEDSYPPLFPEGERRRGAYRDQLEVLFPPAGSGPTLPHFVFGDSRRPVDLWRWTAAGVSPIAMSRLEEMHAAGVSRPPALLPAVRQRATGRGSWVEGRWTVVLRRPIGQDAPFAADALVPVAFHVRDGSNGETGLRMAVSSWYYLHLREPTGARELLLVFLVVLGVAGAEYAAVRTIRRFRERGRLTAYGVGGQGSAPSSIELGSDAMR